MHFAAGYLRFASTRIEPNLRFAFTRHDPNYRLLTLRVQIGKQSGIILMSLATHHLTRPPSPTTNDQQQTTTDNRQC
jgi:hypothetical protein